ncbi:MAG: hypothetical protein DWQ37_09270 [Planctomycetota bacterium]|nr:MAG: hypothetical protein DWQ37_09270 [Planctomycetota bacterium]
MNYISDHVPSESAWPASRLGCMEVGGGNGNVRKRYAMAGLDLYILGRPAAPNFGGDVHFISSCASGRITRMLLADVCAPRPLFAELSAAFRWLMARYINSISQARLAEEVHGQIRSFWDRGALTTTVMGTFFSPTRSLSLWNAGHPPPLVYRHSRRSWHLLRRTDAPRVSASDAAIPLVSKDETQKFSERLEKDDLILCYSNTVAECASEGRFRNARGLLDQLNQCQADTPHDILTLVSERLESAGWDSEGDSTVSLLQLTDRPVSVSSNLLAPFRFLRGVRDRSKLR